MIQLQAIREGRGTYWNLESNSSVFLPYALPSLSHFCTVVQDYSTLVIGGLQGTTASSVLELTETLLGAKTPMLIARGDSCAVVIDKCLVVIGGFNFESEVVLSQCEVLENDKWKFLPNLKVPRRSASACVLDSCIYVFGGEAEMSIESLKLGDKKWRYIGLKLPSIVNQPGLCCLSSTRVLLLGGIGKLGEMSGEVYGLDISTKTWTRLKPLRTPFKPSSSPRLVRESILLTSEDSILEYDLGNSSDPLSPTLPFTTSPRFSLAQSHTEETDSSLELGVLKANPHSIQSYSYYLPPNPCVLFIKKTGLDSEILDEFKHAISLMQRFGCSVLVEASCLGIADNCGVFLNSSTDKVNLVVTIGGDGTMIWAIGLFKGTHMPPVVSFNKGSLGFVTRYNIEEVERVLTEVLTSQVLHVDVSSRLEAWVDQGGLKEYKGQSANEFCIDKGPSSSILGIDIWLNDCFMTTAYGDGLLVSSPLGSTGYSMSTGASIVHPDVPAILISPICSHSLSFRPIIVPDSSVIRLTIPRNSRCDAWICIDGQTRFLLPIGDSLIIQMSAFPIPHVELHKSIPKWIHKLKTELMWNLRRPQKVLETGVVTPQ